MNLLGADVATAAELERDRGRAVTLFASAPEGPILVATRSEGAWLRAVDGGLAAGRWIIPAHPDWPEPEVTGVLASAAAAVVDPDVAPRWALPETVWTVRPVTRVGALGRLLGRKADTGAFPECLRVLAPGAGRAGGGLFVPGVDLDGQPRDRRCPRAQLEADASAIAAAQGVDASSRVLHLLSPYHHAGVLLGPILARATGATLVRPGGAVVEDPVAVLDHVWRHRVTHLFVGPALAAVLLRAGSELAEVFADDGFRAMVLVGGRLPDAAWAKLEALSGRPVGVLTADPSTGATFLTAPGLSGRGQLGRPLQDHVRSGADAAVEVRGEDGAWRAIGERGAPAGDGSWTAVGAVGPTLYVAGERVAPEAVRDVIAAAPGVETVTVEVEEDPNAGPRLVARVHGQGVRVAELDTFLRARLAGHKVPRRLLLDGEEDPGPPAEGIDARVLAIASRIFREPAARLDHGTRAGDVPGWDSLAHLDFVAAIERAFRVRITARDLVRLRSIGDAVALVEAASDG